MSKNCLSALRHLRKKLRGFTIWVDAICINQSQENNTEKEQQIPLMGEMYSGAEVTYVWLGEGNERSDKAMAYLGRAGFVKYLALHRKPRVWAAIWFMHRTLRCGKNDLLLCTGTSPTVPLSP